MHKKTEVICGISDLKPNFEEIGNNPNFVFENDPNFETIKLFDVEGNIVNVNSWLECANYVNGGWTNNISDFVDGEKFLFFFLTVLLTIGVVVEKKYGIFKRV
tara:strand:+ start:295 stop:603 length:309 start_codon:yes stop_codon:yes gene_type:complete